jgi:glutamate formiminotransferase
LAKVKAIVQSMRVEGVHLLDFSLDADHNRSVVTIAGAPNAVLEAAIRSAGVAAEMIDLTKQTGVHPRIGSADVIPFVPVSKVSLAECAVIARQAGLQIWRRFGVPVYFYGAAAARPDRVELENVRRGQFEGLREVSFRDASRKPDVGGPELHATAGASAVGARSFLIAYNIYVEPASKTAIPQAPDVGVVRAIAREIRASAGGLHGLKAIGVIANGRPQVSMNITDYRVTPVRRVYEAVQQLAKRHGARCAGSELIGLLPEDAYEPSEQWAAEIADFDPEQKVLERKLDHPLAWPE